MLDDAISQLRAELQNTTSKLEVRAAVPAACFSRCSSISRCSRLFCGRRLKSWQKLRPPTLRKPSAPRSAPCPIFRLSTVSSQPSRLFPLLQANRDELPTAADYKAAVVDMLGGDNLLQAALDQKLDVSAAYTDGAVGNTINNLLANQPASNTLRVTFDMIEGRLVALEEVVWGNWP